MNGNTSDQEYFDKGLEFWVYTGFCVPLSLGALYLSVTQIIFLVEKEYFGCKSATKWRKNGPSTRKKTHRALKNNAVILNSMSAFGAVCAFLRAGIDLRHFYGRNNDFGCNVAIKFKLAIYFLSLISIYMVLWLRQRVFYQHPRLKHLSSKFIRFVSWSICVVMISGMLAVSVIFLGVGKYAGLSTGCTIRGPITSSRWIILIGCTSVFQVCLLALFIYPLLKHKRGVRRSIAFKKNDIIIHLMQRATVTSILSVATDIGFALLIFFADRDAVTMSTFVCDVNIVFNAFCTVMSFPDWKARLMPWKIRRKERPESEHTLDGQSKVLPTDSIA